MMHRSLLVLLIACGSSAPATSAPAASATSTTPSTSTNPTSDDDGDGIAAADDACPCVAEDTDGEEDEDGCPEVCDGGLSAVRFREGLYLSDDAGVAIEAAVRFLNANENATLTVQGHARPGEDQPAALARSRAEAVRDQLLLREIPNARLAIDQVVDPLADPIADTPPGPRVEFIAVGAPCIIEESARACP